MSLLMFIQEETSVIVVTDTLSQDLDGVPFNFQSKVFPLPHLSMVIATTGIANVGAEWFRRLCEAAVVQNVHQVDLFAQQELLSIHRQLIDAHGELPSCTIYHFGIDPETGKAVRYTYRSRTGFASELTTEPGFGIKPVPVESELKHVGTLEEIIELAEVVKRENDSGVAQSPVGIGGELYLTLLQTGSTATNRVHRFSDYEDAWKSMIGRLQRPSMN